MIGTATFGTGGSGLVPGPPTGKFGIGAGPGTGPPTVAPGKGGAGKSRLGEGSGLGLLSSLPASMMPDNVPVRNVAIGIINSKNF